MVSRPDYWWPEVFWGEHVEDDRAGGGKAFFVALHEDENGVADGYAEYEVKGEWSGGHSRRSVGVYDLQATNPTAHAALWRYLLDIDLVTTITATNLAIDDPLRHLLADGRQARVDYINDALWLAPLDPARCSRHDGIRCSTGTSSSKCTTPTVCPPRTSWTATTLRRSAS